MNDTVYVGIDPGLKGFITVLDNNEYIVFYSIPTTNKGKAVDVNGLVKVIGEIMTGCAGRRVVFGLESVHAIFGSSAGSTFNFGWVVGVIEGILAAHDAVVMRPAPKTWQKEMWKDVPLVKKKSMTGKTEVVDTKATSIAAARRLYPNVDLRRTEKCRNFDDNKCDSLLIATYLKRMNY